jgi:hypothetical protein
VTIEGLLVDLSIERRRLHLMGEGKYFRLFAFSLFLPFPTGHSRVSLARVLDLCPGTPPCRTASHPTYQSGVFAKLRFGQFIPGTGSAGARQRLSTIGLFTIQ